jgi:DNA-binding MarR family transcriptional regulator
VRNPDHADRRRVEIAITAEGRRALEEADRLIVQRLRDVPSELDPERVTRIVSALQDLGTALYAYRARGIDPETGTITDRRA